MTETANAISIFGSQFPVAVFTAGVGLFSAIIAAGIALLVNHASNRQQNVRLKLQLDHDSRQRDQERKMQLRREVFLQAMTACIRAGKYLGKIPTEHTRNNDLKTLYEDFDPALSKLHLIAKLPTIRRTFELSECFSQATTELTAIRFPLSQKLEQIKQGEKEIQTEQSLQQSILSRVGEFKHGPTEQNEISALKNFLNASQQRIDAVQNATARINDESAREQFALFPAAQKWQVAFGAKLVDLEIEIRREFDFELGQDEATYRSEAKETFERNQKRLESFITELEQKVGVSRKRY